MLCTKVMYHILSHLFKTELWWHISYPILYYPKPGLLVGSFLFILDTRRHTLSLLRFERDYLSHQLCLQNRPFFGSNQSPKKIYSPTQKPIILQYHPLTPNLPSHDPDYIILIHLFLQNIKNIESSEVFFFRVYGYHQAMALQSSNFVWRWRNRMATLISWKHVYR